MRQQLGGTPFRVVTVISTRPFTDWFIKYFQNSKVSPLLSNFLTRTGPNTPGYGSGVILVWGCGNNKIKLRNTLRLRSLKLGHNWLKLMLTFRVKTLFLFTAVTGMKATPSSVKVVRNGWKLAEVTPHLQISWSALWAFRGVQICTTVENGYYLIGDITGAQYNEDDISLISRLILSVVTNITELVSEAQPQQ